LPDLGSNIVVCGSDSTDFICVINGLQPNTKYHVRAYATNLYDLTGYGNDLPFWTNAVGGFAKHAGKYVFHNGKIIYIE
jgi:hypothetical protein